MWQLLNQGIFHGVADFVGFIAQGLLPFMLAAFAMGITLRAVIYYTVRREFWFVKEFEKRVYAELDAETQAGKDNFFQFSRRILERTYFEVFELRSRYKRRNPDHIMTISDRLFLVQDGAARLIGDTLKRLRYFERSGRNPDLTELSQVVFNANPAFSRVFGIFPASVCNGLLDILPGVFVISGIFGTFIGIMNALPQLSGMDLANPEATKSVMDAFLAQMAHSVVTSILGIFLSVVTTVYNTAVDPEGLFVSIVDRYSSVLNVIWNRCQVAPGTSLIDDNSQPMDERELEAREALARQLYHSNRRAMRDLPRAVPMGQEPVDPSFAEAPAPTEDQENSDSDKWKRSA